MTKEELLRLQDLQRNSGLPLMKYFDKVGLKYSTYTYWKRKFRFSPSTEDDVPFAPVRLRTPSDVTLPVHTGNITLQFLNGVRVCLESSMGEFNLQMQSNSNLLILN
jgi:putative transposase